MSTPNSLRPDIPPSADPRGGAHRARQSGATESRSQVVLAGRPVDLDVIEAALREDPELAAVRVSVKGEGENAQIVAHIVPAASALASDTASALDREHLDQWYEVFERTYRDSADAHAGDFNISGFSSSYTGMPLPAVEVREWVEHTVARILDLHPRRLLEIGCGAGLLLSRVAPLCERYVGSDFSKEALRFVREHHGLQPWAERVELRQESADRMTCSEVDRFDTVVMNSVAQYFPSAEYLEAVIATAVAALVDGGRFFIGDVRSLPLLEAFHADLVLACVREDYLAEDAQRRVRRGIASETELVLDPGFFFALRATIPRIAGVRIWPKRGVHANEFSQFRYDVVLEIGAAADVRDVPFANWTSEVWSLPQVESHLRACAPEAFGLAAVENVRVARAVAAQALLAACDGDKTAGDLRRRLACSVSVGIDPEAWWALAEEHGYRVELSWTPADAGGRYDVALLRDRVGLSPQMPLSPRGSGRTANRPLQRIWGEKCIPALRERMAACLPPHLRPALYVVVETLPDIAHGPGPTSSAAPTPAALA